MANKEFRINIRLRRVYDGDNTHNPTETTEKAFLHFLDVWNELLVTIRKNEQCFEDWGWEWDIGPYDLIRRCQNG